MKRKSEDLYNNSKIIRLFKLYWSLNKPFILDLIENELQNINLEDRDVYIALLDHTLYSNPDALNKIKSMNYFDVESIEKILDEIERLYL